MSPKERERETSVLKQVLLIDWPGLRGVCPDLTEAETCTCYLQIWNMLQEDIEPRQPHVPVLHLRTGPGSCPISEQLQ